MPIIRVLIFRGTGGVYNPDHPYHGEPALVRAGHVGVSGVIEGKIIGFHPTSEAAEAIGGEKELLEALKDKQPQPGRLQDDERFAPIAGISPHPLTKFASHPPWP